MQDNFIQALVPIVGTKNLLTGDSDTAPYTADWRRQYRGAAAAVVRPEKRVAAAAPALIALVAVALAGAAYGLLR